MFVVFDKIRNKHLAVLDTDDNIIELVTTEELKVVELKGHWVVLGSDIDDVIKVEFVATKNTLDISASIISGFGKKFSYSLMREYRGFMVCS